MKLVVLFLVVFPVWGSDVLSQSSWTRMPSPTQHDLRKLSFLDSLNGWVAGDSGTILKTTNGGETWIGQNSGIAESIVDIFMLNERRGWAVAPWYIDTTIYTYLLSTTNGGNTWQSQYWLAEYLTTVYFSDSLVGWVGSGLGKIFKTTNGGSAWTETVIEPVLFSLFPKHNLKFFSPVFGFAMGGRIEFQGVVWRTTNAGETWTARGIAPEPVNDLHFVDSLNIVGVFADPDYLGAGLVTTTDGGGTWDYRYLGIWGDARALAVRTRAEMWSPLGFAATYMYTLDSGATWTSIYTPDTTAIYDAVFTDERTGYMVGAEGTILKYDFVTNVDEEQIQVFPLNAFLHQNYPNPFNSTTVIGYQIPASNMASLKVYNVLGQEVATLVHELKQPGRHEVRFEAEELPSGIYFYRLQAGMFVQTRKLIFLR